MFATLELYESKSKGIERLKELFFGGRIICEKVNLPENEYFYRIKVPLKKGAIPYDNLKKLSEGIKDGFIFPEGFVCPKEIKQYTPSYFPQLLLFNSAVRLLGKSISEPSGTVITLVDLKGVLSSCVGRLVPLAGEVRVITENINGYASSAEQIMKEFGLSLFVSNKLSSIPREGIIISYDSHHIPLSFKGLLITGEKRFLPFADVLTGEGIKAAPEYIRLCPEKINLQVFLSALCESCFVGELRKTEFEKLVDISAVGI